MNKYLKQTACVLLLGILIFLYCITKQTNRDNSTTVQVFYEIPTAAPSPPANKEYSAKEPPTTASAIPSSSPAIAIANNPESAKEKQVDVSPAIRCEILDLLNSPIPAGTIQYNNQIQPFQNGKAVINNASGGFCQIVASADGYQSATKTVDIKQNQNITFQLDYLCQFKIVVYGDSTRLTRAAKAEVDIYQSMIPPRPIATHHIITLEHNPSYKKIPTEVMVHENKILVEKTSMIRDAMDPYSNPAVGFESFSPATNDEIYAIGQCKWDLQGVATSIISPGLWTKPRFPSPFLPTETQQAAKMRILDTLAFTSQKNNSFNCMETITLRRGCQLGHSSLQFPSIPSERKWIAQLKTDSNGVCLVKDLQPGFYFAQASNNTMKSDLKPLIPSCGGVMLELASKSKLKIFCRLTDLRTKPWIGDDLFEGTKILVQSTGKNTIVMAQTAIKSGDGLIDSLPYGEYRITTQLPDTGKLQNQEVTVNVNQPNQKVILWFDGWERHTISGDVLKLNSNEPVSKYPVIIKNDNRIGTEIQYTDEDGKFEFTNLPAGKYDIGHIITDLEHINYFPYNEITKSNLSQDTGDKNVIYHPAGWSREGVSIEVGKEPVYHVTLNVIPSKKTRFSGSVIDSHSKPVANAFISVLNYSTGGLPLFTTIPNPQTDDKGKFAVTVLSYDFSSTSVFHNGLIRAEIAGIIPRQLKEDKNNKGIILGAHIEEEKIVSSSHGQAPVSFQFGDSLEGISIVVDDPQKRKLEGWIKGEGDRVPDELSLSIEQNGIQLSTEIPSQGHFITYGLEPQHFTVCIQEAFNYDIQYPSGRIRYLNDVISLEFPPDKDAIFVNIVLKEAGYLVGRITAANGSPGYIAQVIAKSPGQHDEVDYTDFEGKFRLNVPKNSEYSLYVAPDNTEGQEKEYLAHLHPNQDNIIIQMK